MSVTTNGDGAAQQETRPTGESESEAATAPQRAAEGQQPGAFRDINVTVAIPTAPPTEQPAQVHHRHPIPTTDHVVTSPAWGIVLTIVALAAVIGGFVGWALAWHALPQDWFFHVAVANVNVHGVTAHMAVPEPQNGLRVAVLLLTAAVAALLALAIARPLVPSHEVDRFPVVASTMTGEDQAV